MGCSYGPDYRFLFERAAVIVAKVLNGAKPANVPIEQATKFELLVNRTTARRLGINLPQSLLAQADHVIE